MDSMLNWFEFRNFLSLPNYFWILCALLVLLALVCILFGILLGKKTAKIKTLKNVLAEEKTYKSCDVSQCKSCDPEEGHSDKVDASELAIENELLSKDLDFYKNMLEESQCKVDDLEAESESLKKRVVELEEDNELKETKCAELESKLKETLTVLDSLKVKNVEAGAEIASYKATNDILSKSIDNLKAQIADQNDLIESLKQKIADLQSVKKQAAEEAENNKVLMKAVKLIMDSKEESAESKKVILHEDVRIPVAEKPKKTRKAPVKKAAVAKPVEENLETMKRPDLMHLAKREGVKRFARKSNQEIIRLIRENRESK